MTIYYELLKINATMDNYKSDLYVKKSPKVHMLLKKLGVKFEAFVSNVDGGIWLEVPFGYDPYWNSLENQLADNMPVRYS